MLVNKKLIYLRSIKRKRANISQSFWSLTCGATLIRTTENNLYPDSLVGLNFSARYHSQGQVNFILFIDWLLNVTSTRSGHLLIAKDGPPERASMSYDEPQLGLDGPQWAELVLGHKSRYLATWLLNVSDVSATRWRFESRYGPSLLEMDVRWIGSKYRN